MGVIRALYLITDVSKPEHRSKYAVLGFETVSRDAEQYVFDLYGSSYIVPKVKSGSNTDLENHCLYIEEIVSDIDS